MYDSNDDNDYAAAATSFMGRFPPPVRAALIFAIPFIIADFFNYYTAGAASLLSMPILALLYAGCGATAAYFAVHDGGPAGSSGVIGAGGGMLLWLISTIVNTVISMIFGTFSLGATLLLGVPYLLCCTPLMLFGGAIAGGLGGVIYGAFGGRSTEAARDSSY